MPIASGTRLGSYEVIGELGAGAMGEVYRARDVRLQREVALKLLPPHLTSDTERLARFEREARVLAALSHPNIAAIYGIEECATATGGRMPVLVLELVEGETLQERIARGLLSVDDARVLALQIADGLEAAHDKGIVHRDLKPANIKITPDGAVKILDFGLAKALDANAGGTAQDPAQSPTFTATATALGVIMGTAAYMAPEQARGQLVDRRADIWAFGAVLFEMLAGDRAFPGQTMSDTLAAVLTADPPWAKLPAGTPPHIRRLLERCLDRAPRTRLQSIGEARIALSASVGKDDVPVAQIAGGARAPVPWRPVTAASLALAALAFAAGWWLTPADTRTHGVLRKLDLAIDDSEINLEHPPVLSPDGQRVLYRAAGRLWVRALADFAPQALPSTDGARYPLWSPDSREVAFVRDQRVWRVPLVGGEATPVGAAPADLSGSGGGVWMADNQIVIAGSDSVGLLAVPLSGATAREILPLEADEESDFHEISALPNGRDLLFTTHRRSGTDTIDVLTGGRRRTVLQLTGENLRAPVYSSGYLLFVRETTVPGVWAIRFSPETLETTGDPFLVVLGGGSPSVGADGTLVVVRPSERPSQLVWLDRGGALSPIALLPGQLPWRGLRWAILGMSADRQRVAVAVRQGPSLVDLWSYDLARGGTTRLSTGAGAVAVNPTWAADARQVFFSGFVGQRIWNIYRVPSSETGTPERLLPSSDEAQWPCSVSADGAWLLYAQGSIGQMDLWVARLDGSVAPRALMTTPVDESDAKFSPDGRWIVYSSNETGRSELYLRAFPIDGERVQLTTGGAAFPAWSPDGREIFYRTPGALMSVAVGTTAAGLQPSAPRQLFAIADPLVAEPFGVSADAQRFLFVRSGGSERVSVVLNWAAQVPGLDRAAR